MSKQGGSWISRDGDWYPNEKVKNNGAHIILKKRGVTHLTGHDKVKIKEDLTVLNQPTSRKVVKTEK